MALDEAEGLVHSGLMAWVVLGWLLVVGGVTGFVIGLRRSRHNDEVERGLFVWMTLAWIGVAVLVSAEVA